MALSEQTIQTGGFDLVDVACDFCGTTERRVVFVKRGAAIEHAFAIVQCAGCSLVYVSPRVADHDIPRLYDAAYYEGRGFDRTVSYAQQAREDGMSPENDAALETLSELLDLAGTRTLDIGCGTGKLVSALAARGASAFGLESSAAGRAICASRGVEVIASDLFEPGLDGQRFEAITAIEVIEHVPSPTRFLQRIRELLRPGGILFLTTGNWNLVRRETGTPYVMPEGHIYYFTPTTMRAYLAKAGFAEETRTFSKHWFAWRRLPARARSVLGVPVRVAAKVTRRYAPDVGPFPIGKNPG
jgi:2-polyprenyl-3-methyl-5-hydroxy-6-metoxy-1,4-benzoquinol methylase